MDIVDKLYKKENFKIQKSINLEDKLYTKLKEVVENKYDATFSEVVNVCIEELITKNNISYYAKPEGEIAIYRSVMIRKENINSLNKINKKTGISVTRLINIAIKEFINKYEREKGKSYG